jgi:hypothetical protein
MPTPNEQDEEVYALLLSNKGRCKDLATYREEIIASEREAAADRLEALRPTALRLGGYDVIAIDSGKTAVLSGQSASPNDGWDILYEKVCDAVDKMKERDWSEGTALMLIDEIRQIFEIDTKPATPLQEARDRGATDEGYDNLVFADEIILKISQRLDLDFSEMLWAEMNDDICDLLEARAALAADKL